MNLEETNLVLENYEYRVNDFFSLHSDLFPEGLKIKHFEVDTKSERIRMFLDSITCKDFIENNLKIKVYHLNNFFSCEDISSFFNIMSIKLNRFFGFIGNTKRKQFVEYDFLDLTENISSLKCVVFSNKFYLIINLKNQDKELSIDKIVE